MTAEEFIDALDAKGVLPAAMLDKLRQKIQQSSKPLSAKSLGRFLIEKGHLTKPQVIEVLAAGGEVAPPAAEPATPQQPAGEPSGISVPMDELQDLSSSAEWTLDEGGGGFAEPTAETATAGKAGKKKKKKSGKKANEWDSPLLLIGGGGLVLMVIVGAVIGIILFYESADALLSEARQAMQEGNYGKGIANYERFVENFKGNADYSTARVELAMARIRSMLESGNVTRAFAVAEEELRAIGDEPDFNAAQEQLTELLPRIARGLADQAEASDTPEQKQQLYDDASSALAMANNTKYIPRSRRDNTELDGIRATLERIERRQESLSDLAAALATIDQAIADGDTQAAFAAQEELVEEHPSLLSNPRLAEALVKISAAERDNIRFVEEPSEAATSELNTAVSVTLALANRRVEGSAPLDGVYAVQHDGVVYGVEAGSGKLLWRRYVGPSLQPIDPLPVGGDLLLVEWRPADGEAQRQALTRVNATSGSLKWRLEIDDELAAPVVAGNQVFLAGASGRLHVVDAESGTRVGYVQFSQPLTSPPTVNPQARRMHLAGERSSVYTLSLQDLSCLGVKYTNHPRGSMVAPPAVALDKVVFVENDGARTCNLQLYQVDGDAAVGDLIAERRLEGRVVQQPQVDGRRFVVITDLGQISVFEVSVDDGAEPLVMLADRSASSSRPFLRYGTLAAGHIWFAENALTKYALAPTGNQLAVQTLTSDFNRSEFLAPLEVRDNVLLHVRSPRGRAGIAVTASRTDTGEAYWETDLGVPPAGSPLVSTSPVAVLEADANGRVYRFDREAIRARVLDTALAAPSGDDPTDRPFDQAILLQGGAAVFAAVGSEHALLFSPNGEPPLSRVTLPGALACQPTAFGDGWIAPLVVGQIFYLDSKSGSPLAAPFQPPLAPGQSVTWQPVSVVDESQLLATDGTEKIYLIELQQSNAPALVAVTEAAVGPAPLATPLVAHGGRAYAGTEDGRLAVVQLPSLDAADPIALPARVAWGPYRAGDHLVLRTENNELIAIDDSGSRSWQVATSKARFTGPPLVSNGAMVVALESGEVLKFSLSDGSEQARSDTGQPITSGPVVLNGRLLVAAHDGALLVLEEL